MALLGKHVTEIRYIESAHHASGLSLGMGEATAVEAYWRKKLQPALETSFRHARDYLIVEKQLSGVDALKKLDGKPVIASDTDNHRYFKRLRVGKDRVVLESMDSGGDYASVILELPGNG